MQPDEKDSDCTLHHTTINNIEEDLDAHDNDSLLERVNNSPEVMSPPGPGRRHISNEV